LRKPQLISSNLMMMTGQLLTPQRPCQWLRESSTFLKKNAMSSWTICERMARIWIFRMPKHNGSCPGDRHGINVHS
jgi:hypothetical protein